MLRTLGLCKQVKIHNKRWKRGQRAQSLGEVIQDGNHFRRAFVRVPQSKAAALSINSVFFLDGAATAFLTSSPRRVAMSMVC